MSFCNSCLSFWKKSNSKKLGTSGTCMMDGSRTQGQWGCGYHSDKYLRKNETQVAPDKRGFWKWMRTTSGNVP